MPKKYDFGGWATKINIKCADGRTIRKDAFADCDGLVVPLVWNHNHSDPEEILGHALLENREDGVYTYAQFNNTAKAQAAKELVNHGDIEALSIYANKLKQTKTGDVLHGMIREVSLVLGGANPGAYIDRLSIAHGEDGEIDAIIYNDSIDEIELYHADDDTTQDVADSELEHSNNTKKGDKQMPAEEKEETVQDVVNTMNDQQIKVMDFLITQAVKEVTEKGDGEMSHNIFEENAEHIGGQKYLSHSDEQAILELAKRRDVATLQNALEIYFDDHAELAHGIDEIESLFPDFHDLNTGAPETLKRDLGWVSTVMNGVRKSPYSRLRTRQADARAKDLRALGYVKGKKKKEMPNVKLLKRTTDPQTVYVKDSLHRDDTVDIVDFDVVAYQHSIMKDTLNEEIATAIMIGDGREEADEDKISEEHIRSIWHDDELYTIHSDIDIEGQKAALQGSNTGANFGENFIYSESIVTAALYSRENYKGSGSLKYFCTPHVLNVMLLARDLNGRRIYSSKSDLEAAMNVTSIETAEQFENKTRKTKDNKVKKLLGIFVNLDDYTVGATKGGEITHFDQFDIDFNQQKFLIETRISGSLTRVFSAIVLEEDVTPSGTQQSNAE